MGKEIEVFEGIVLTERHMLKFDSKQFRLHIKNMPKDFKGWDKVNYSSVSNHPTISNLIKHISIDECKDILKAYYEIKDFGEKFDELMKNPHYERLDIATKWFEQFLFTSELQDKYENKCKELKEVKDQLKIADKKIAKYLDMSDESDAVSDVQQKV